MRKEATIPLLRSESVISQSFFFKLEYPLSFHIAVKNLQKNLLLKWIPCPVLLYQYLTHGKVKLDSDLNQLNKIL